MIMICPLTQEEPDILQCRSNRKENIELKRLGVKPKYKQECNNCGMVLPKVDKPIEKEKVAKKKSKTISSKKYRPYHDRYNSFEGGMKPKNATGI